MFLKVVDILYDTTRAWLRRYGPTTFLCDLPSLAFAVGLAIQGGLAIGGTLDLAIHRREWAWAVPVLSHIHIAVMAIYALWPNGKGMHRPVLLFLWAGTAGSATLLSALFLALSITGYAPHASLQCMLCAIMLSINAKCDLSKAHEDVEVSTKGLVIHHNLTRCSYYHESGLELLPSRSKKSNVSNQIQNPRTQAQALSISTWILS